MIIRIAGCGSHDVLSCGSVGREMVVSLEQETKSSDSNVSSSALGKYSCVPTGDLNSHRVKTSEAKEI